MKISGNVPIDFPETQVSKQTEEFYEKQLSLLQDYDRATANDEIKYYDDKINLNNVMGPVLELLNAASYTYLQFNRLARTDNAIVFQVELMSSTNMLPSNEVGDNG